MERSLSVSNGGDSYSVGQKITRAHLMDKLLLNSPAALIRKAARQKQYIVLFSHFTCPPPDGRLCRPDDRTVYKEGRFGPFLSA